MMQYHNKEWLYKKYWVEELSSHQIARLCGVNHVTILNWLNKFNIPCRSRNESIHLKRSNHCNLSQKAIEWISGELLGDACLFPRSPYSARFQYASKYLEYINYVGDTLKSFGVEQAGKIKQYYDKRFGFLGSYQYASLSYPEFLPIQNKWYPKGKKIVPKDIKLTPLTCRQWYIGDGGLLKSKRKNPCIQLYTNGFIISDVNWLAKELSKLGFKATRQIALNIVTISIYSTKAFLDYIGSCPVKCYQYKWNYQDNRRILV